MVWGYIWRIVILRSITQQFFQQDSYTNFFANFSIELLISFASLYWLLKYPYGETDVYSIEENNQVTEIDEAIKISFKEKMQGLFTETFGIIFIAVFSLYSIGNLYWLWMSFKVGSFLMFVLGVFPPTMILCGVIGGYSLIFGLPVWVINLFS